MGSAPQSVPCTQRRPAHHWRSLDTNTNDTSSSDACTDPRVSHFLTSCSEITFVSIVSYLQFDISKQLTSHPYCQHRKTNSPVHDATSCTTNRKQSANLPLQFFTMAQLSWCTSVHRIRRRLRTQFDSAFSPVLWTLLSLSVTIKEVICIQMLGKLSTGIHSCTDNSRQDKIAT